MPGGLAIQTMVAATIMGAMTGIIGGEIVLLGLVALPQMLRLGYDRELAIGTICAGGSLGTMIPPCIVLVIYGLTVNVSIGDLFAANVLPGLHDVGHLHALHLHPLPHRSDARAAGADEERSIPLRDKLLPAEGTDPAGSGRRLGARHNLFRHRLGDRGRRHGRRRHPLRRSGTARAQLARCCAPRRSRPCSACGVLLWVSFGATAMIGVYNLAGGPAFVRHTMIGLDVRADRHHPHHDGRC